MRRISWVRGGEMFQGSLVEMGKRAYARSIAFCNVGSACVDGDN